MELRVNLSKKTTPTDDQVETINRSLREIRERHIELISATKARDAVSDADVDRFYMEISE